MLTSWLSPFFMVKRFGFYLIIMILILFLYSTVQKISPEGKAKIQLQVVLHDSGASTFHFTHPNGQAEQIKERDSVKDLLQQLLPKFKRKVNKELEEKNRLVLNQLSVLKNTST
jgi:hypothetical protein